jgi:WD40 repeat protein
MLDPLTGHTSQITSIVVLDTRNWIISASLGHEFRFWDLVSGKEYVDLKFTCKTAIHRLISSPNNHWLVCVQGDGQVDLWSLLPELRYVGGESSKISSFLSPCFSSDSQYVWVGSESFHVSQECSIFNGIVHSMLIHVLLLVISIKSP